MASSTPVMLAMSFMLTAACASEQGHGVWDVWEAMRYARRHRRAKVDPECTTELPGLNELLSGVKFAIPDPPTVAEDGYDISVSELVCKDLEVNCIDLSGSEQGQCYRPQASSAVPKSDLDSDLLPAHSFKWPWLPFPRRHRHGPEPPEGEEEGPCRDNVHALVYGVQVRCQGHYHYRQRSWPHFKGDGDVTVHVTNSKLALTAHVLKDERAVPSETTMDASECAAHVRISAIDFDAGVVGWLLNLLRATIKASLSKSMSQQACAAVVALVNVNGTEGVRSVRDDIYSWLDVPPPASRYPSLPPGLVDLRSNQVVGLFSQLADDLVAPDGPWSVNSLVELFVQDASFAKDLDMLILSQNSTFVNVEATLQEASVSGLDSITAFDVIRTAKHDPHHLWFTISFGQLRVSVTASAAVSPGPLVSHGKGTLRARVSANTTLHNVTLRAGLLLGLNQSALQGLAISQLAIPACLARTVDASELLPLEITADAVDQWEVAGIGVGIDTVVTQAVRLGQMVLESAALQVLPRVADGPLRERLDSTLQQALLAYQQGLCPDTPSPASHPVAPPAPPLPVEPRLPPGMVVWRNSPLLGLASGFASAVLGPGGIWGVNQLIDLELPKDRVERYSFKRLNLWGRNSSLVDVSVGLKSVEIGGLDTFRRLTFVEPVQDHSLRFIVDLGNLTLRATVAVALQPGRDVRGGGDARTMKRTRRVTLTVPLHNASAQGVLLLAVREEAANALALRQLVRPACLARVVYACNVTALQVWLGELLAPSVQGLGPDADPLFFSLASKAVAAYGEQLVVLINARLNSFVTGTLNQALGELLAAAKRPPCRPLAPLPPPAPPQPPLPEPKLPPGMLVWNGTEEARAFVKFLDTIGGVGGLWDVNLLVPMALPGARYLWRGDAARAFATPLVDFAVTLESVEASHLDSFERFEVSASVMGGPHELAMEATVGRVVLVAIANVSLGPGSRIRPRCVPENININHDQTNFTSASCFSAANISTQDGSHTNCYSDYGDDGRDGATARPCPHARPPFRPNITFTMELRDVRLYADVVLAVERARFSALAINQLLDPACLARTVHAAAIHSVDVRIGGIRSVSLEGLGEDAAKVVAGLERKVQESFGLELEQALEAVADGALRRAANWRIADALEQYRLATCPDAHRTVPAPPPTPPSDPSHLPEGLVDWMANAPLKAGRSLIHELIPDLPGRANMFVDHNLPNGTLVWTAAHGVHAGSWSLPPLPPLPPLVAQYRNQLVDLRVEVRQLSISLDQFKAVDALRPRTRRSLSFQVALGATRVSMVADVRAAPGAGVRASSLANVSAIHKRVHLELPLHSFELDLALLLAVQEERALELQLGQLHLPGCVAKTIRAVNFTTAGVSGRVHGSLASVAGFGPDADVALTRAARLALASYEADIFPALQSAMAAALVSVNGDILKSLDLAQLVPCSAVPAPSNASSPEYVQWPTSILRYTDFVVRTVLLTNYSMLAEKAIARLTNGTAAVSVREGVSLAYTGPKFGHLQLEVGNFTMDGLDNVYNASFLQPAGRYSLTNRVGLAGDQCDSLLETPLVTSKNKHNFQANLDPRDDAKIDDARACDPQQEGGDRAAATVRPLRASVGVRLRYQQQDAKPGKGNAHSRWIEDDFTMQLSTRDALADTAAEVLVNADLLRHLTVRDAARWSCLAGVTESVKVESVVTRVQTAELAMLCRNCSTPMLLDLQHLLRNDPSVQANLTARLSRALANPKASGLASLAAAATSAWMNDFLNNTARGCVVAPPPPPLPPSPLPDNTPDRRWWPPSSRTWIRTLLPGGAALVGVLVLTAWLATSAAGVFCSEDSVDDFDEPLAQDRRPTILSLDEDVDPTSSLARPLLSENSGDAHENGVVGDGEAAEAARKLAERSLMMHAAVPEGLRWAMPTLVALNVALFVVAHVTVGASVLMRITAAGETFQLEPLFEFTLRNSVCEMWRARVFALALLVLGLSGVWPYLKLTLLLAAWVAPPTVLPVRPRARLLVWVEVLGKWSLIDTFVLVMMMVAFKFTLSLAQLAEWPALPASAAVVHVTVEPGPSVFIFLAAAMLSLVVGHVVLYYHRKTTKDWGEGAATFATTRAASSPAVGSEALCLHVYHLPSERGGERFRRVRVRAWARVALGLAVLLVGCAVYVSAVQAAFGFSLQGAARAAVGPERADTNFSILSMASALARSTNNPHDKAPLVLQAAFALLALGFPMANMAAVLMLWAVPLSSRGTYRVLMLAEVCHAWSSLEVFVVAVVAAVAEISQFAQFILGHRCDEINWVLGKYLSPLVQDGDYRCYDVRTTLHASSAYWVVTVLLMWMLHHLVTRLCEKALQERVALAAQVLMPVDAELHGRDGHASDTPGLSNAPLHALRVCGLLEELNDGELFCVASRALLDDCEQLQQLTQTIQNQGGTHLASDQAHVEAEPAGELEPDEEFG